MSLYGNFTLKDWLSLHNTTEDLEKHFRKALKDNDAPMSVLALTELISRGDTDIVTYAIKDATDEGCFTLGSQFSIVFANALTKCGNRNPFLRRIAANARKKGYWPSTSAELFDGTNDRPVAQSDAKLFDDRLDAFLKSFAREGWFSIEFGVYLPEPKWDPHCKEQRTVNAGEYYTLAVKDGFVQNRSEIPNVLDLLDRMGIEDALPAFSGKEMVLYIIGDDGEWVYSEEAKEEGFFYVSYYSVG